MKSEIATIECPNCKGSGRVENARAYGALMKRRRNEASRTLNEVAEYMGISISYLSDLEHGRKKWRPALKLLFLDALARTA